MFLSFRGRVNAGEFGKQNSNSNSSLSSRLEKVVERFAIWLMIDAVIGIVAVYDVVNTSW